MQKLSCTKRRSALKQERVQTLNFNIKLQGEEMSLTREVGEGEGHKAGALSGGGGGGGGC